MAEASENIITDIGKWEWSEMWKKEDWWAIFLGMLVSNTVGTPKWAAPAIHTEYYIKTGIVLLGAKVLFEKVVTIGTAGIFVAWVVIPTVWLITLLVWPEDH
jgi:uncharacterized membrane protein YadS